MIVPPPAPWYARYGRFGRSYGAVDRPRAGCGCFYLLLVLLLVWLAWSWLLPLLMVG